MTDAERDGTRRPPRRRRRRRPRALLLIVVIGVAAIAATVAVLSSFDNRPHGPYLIGAWTYGDRDSLDDAVDAGAIDELSVDWLRSCRDGSVTAPECDDDFVDAARDADCRVMVTLTDYSGSTHRFDSSISAAILTSAASRARHAAAIAAWCDEHDVDGVDVDWEAVDASRRDAFSAFVEELARQLHADDRLVAVDVYPKTSEPGGWDGPQSQDWRRLGRAVDQFRIMTYNYSGSWSGPGPISPPVWIDRVLDFAETLVPARRIVMGLGFYGRAWHGSSTTDLVWGDVQAIRADADPREYRTRSRELRLVYRGDDGVHTAYFPDAVAIRAKLETLVTKHPRIRGVYAWLMGQEDPAVWHVLRRLLHSESGGASE